LFLLSLHIHGYTLNAKLPFLKNFFQLHSRLPPEKKIICNFYAANRSVTTPPSFVTPPVNGKPVPLSNKKCRLCIIRWLHRTHWIFFILSKTQYNINFFLWNCCRLVLYPQLRLFLQKYLASPSLWRIIILFIYQLPNVFLYCTPFTIFTVFFLFYVFSFSQD